MTHIYLKLHLVFLHYFLTPSVLINKHSFLFMSFSRNFAALSDPNRENTLGHAYPYKHILVQEKLQPDPINNIYYVDNEYPTPTPIPTDEQIFKINHPVGSLLMLYYPLSTFSNATLLQRNTPDQIDYSYYGCIFRYLYNNNFGHDIPIFLTSCNSVRSQGGLYYENSSMNGSTTSSINFIGTTDGHTLTLQEIPNHTHLCAHVNSDAHAHSDGTHWPAHMSNRVGSTYGYNTPTDGIQNYNGTTQPHSHDFSVNYSSIHINPPHYGIFVYYRFA